MDFQEIFLDNFSDIFAGRTNAQGRSFAETGSGFYGSKPALSGLRPAERSAFVQAGQRIRHNRPIICLAIAAKKC